MRLSQTNRRFRPYAPYVIGALLCLWFSLGVHPHKSSNAYSENDFSSLQDPVNESTSSPNQVAAKFIVAPAQFSIRGAMRDEHSQAHPSNLPPEPFTMPALISSHLPPNNLADVRSLIFLSPLQDRAPPRFA